MRALQEIGEGKIEEMGLHQALPIKAVSDGTNETFCSRASHSRKATTRKVRSPMNEIQVHWILFQFIVCSLMK